MAIKRWNANTSTWELVGTPGTATPAAIGAASLANANTFSSNQTIQGSLNLTGNSTNKINISSKFTVDTSNSWGAISLARYSGQIDVLKIQGTDSTETTNTLRLVNASGNGSALDLYHDSVRFYVEGTTTERMRINASGNVGIGTSSINTYGGGWRHLNIHGGVNGSELRLTGANSGVGTGDGFVVQWNDGANAAYVWSYEAAPIIFGTSAAERMRITSDGNIGIGILSPQSGARIHAYTASGGWNPYVFENINAGGMASVWFKNDGTSTSGQGAVVGLGGSSTGFANYSKRLNIISYANASAGTGSTGITISMEGASDGSQDFRIVTGAGSTASVMVPQANGYLLVGYTSSNGAYRLQVNSQIFATSSSIATSDGRYKENVLPITSGLDIIDSLNPVSFDWKEHPVHNFVPGKTVGFIAQEVKEALKDYEWVDNIIKTNNMEAVLDDEGNEITPAEEFLGIAESNIIPLLVAAVKELRAEVNTLKAQVNN